MASSLSVSTPGQRRVCSWCPVASRVKEGTITLPRTVFAIIRSREEGVRLGAILEICYSNYGEAPALFDGMFGLED